MTHVLRDGPDPSSELIDPSWRVAGQCQAIGAERAVATRVAAVTVAA